MRKQIFSIRMLVNFMFATIFFSACNNDTSNGISNESIINTGRVLFYMTEIPFGGDTEIGTRADKSNLPEKVDLGYGIEGEISIEHESVPTQTRASKPMSDGNYTIIAYKDNARVGQKITFTVSSGVPTITSEKDKFSWLTNGNYIFVCFNEKVHDNEDGTLTINYEDVETALFDKQTITLSGNDQQVKFKMKHVGARVRTKIVAVDEPINVQGVLAYASNSIFTSTNYNIISNQYTQSGAAITKSLSQSYTVKGTLRDNKLQDNLDTVTDNDYLMVFGSTKPEQLTLSISNGSLYHKTLNFPTTRLKQGNAFEANGSYSIIIRLMPQYRYLFEDGQTGFLSNTERKGHVPIAVVFTANRAVALWNANGGKETKWYEQDPNSQTVTDLNDRKIDDSDMWDDPEIGKHWTWDASGSTDGKIKADEPALYPACYYAGHFYETDLPNHLNGKTLAAKLAQKGVWYLPSMSEWAKVAVSLGHSKGDYKGLHGDHWDERWVNYAFKVANGTSLNDETEYRHYWSSSQNSLFVFGINIDYYAPRYRQGMSWNFQTAGSKKHLVRPFITF